MTQEAVVDDWGIGGVMVSKGKQSKFGDRRSSLPLRLPRIHLGWGPKLRGVKPACNHLSY
jgi:hypothetical protein